MLPGIVGLIQAAEAIKLIIGGGQTLDGRLLLFDAMKMSFKDMKLKKDAQCELCGDHPTITELIDYKAFCEIPMPESEEEEVEDFDEAAFSIDALDLEEILESEDKVVLVDVRNQNEWDICYIENAQLMPLPEFDQYISKLNPEDDIYVYCYKGTRSLAAVKQLHEAGFKNIKSMAGGIDRWAELVDSSMPRY